MNNFEILFLRVQTILFKFRSFRSFHFRINSTPIFCNFLVNVMVAVITSANRCKCRMDWLSDIIRQFQKDFLNYLCLFIVNVVLRRGKINPVVYLGRASQKFTTTTRGKIHYGHKQKWYKIVFRLVLFHRQLCLSASTTNELETVLNSQYHRP